MFGAGLRGRAGPPVPDGRAAPHRPRGQLSSFVGGSAEQPRRWTATQWALAPYTEADLQRQIDLADDVYGDRGTQLAGRPRASTSPASTPTSPRRGLNPTLMPASTRRSARPSSTGRARTSIADGVADRRHLRQGRRQRGGLGAGAAGVRRSASARKRGRKAWADFRSKNDPEAPDDRRRSASRTRPARRSPSAGWRCPTAARSTFDAGRAAGRRPSARNSGSFGAAAGAVARASTPHASNWEMVSAARVGHRPPDRRARPAGRLLRPADPDGEGPPRRRHRRARRRRSPAST